MLKNYAKCFGIIVLTHSLFFLFWFITTKMDESIVRTYISLLEMAADIFLPPILLAFLFLKKLKAQSTKSTKKIFILETAICLFLAFLGSFLDYFNWGFFTKRFFTPDFETRLIFESILFVNLLSVLGQGVVFQLVLIFNKSKNKPK